MYKLPVSNLNDFFKSISKSGQKVYLPVDVGTNKGSQYQPWKEGCEYSKTLNTTRSAKDFFFPQTENLFEMKMNGKNIEVIDTRCETEDFVIFGVRACDVQSFDILDKVFLVDPIDTYYQNRRQHGTIISVACSQPRHTCFCGQIDIDAANPKGDICSWICDDIIYFESNTEKGKKLLETIQIFKNSVCCEVADEKIVETEKQAIAKKIKELPIQFPHGKRFAEENLKEVFSDSSWSYLSESCIGCGTCTFVCPTCQCYDIRDFDTGSGVKRFRCWDSCMYSDFTKMSAGQPRPTQLERFRQRFMHKLVYFPANNQGLLGCVGCGRCLVKCPISMNIVKVAQTLSLGAN